MSAVVVAKLTWRSLPGGRAAGVGWAVRVVGGGSLGVVRRGLPRLKDGIFRTLR